MKRVLSLVIVASASTAHAVSEADVRREEDRARQLREDLATQVAKVPTSAADIRVFVSLSPVLDAIKGFNSRPVAEREVRISNRTDTGDLLTLPDACRSTISLKGVNALKGRGELSNADLKIAANKLTFASHLRLTGDIATRLQLANPPVIQTPSHRRCENVVNSVVDPLGVARQVTRRVCRLIPAVTACIGGGSGFDLPTIGATLDTVVEGTLDLSFDASSGKFVADARLTKPQVPKFDFSVDPGHGLPTTNLPVVIPVPLGISAKSAFPLLLSKDDLTVTLPGDKKPIYVDVRMRPAQARIELTGLVVDWAVSFEAHPEPRPPKR